MLVFRNPKSAHGMQKEEGEKRKSEQVKISSSSSLIPEVCSGMKKVESERRNVVK